ncbi:MAG: ribonuclease III [Thermodesulfobacteriota bacterium]|nr:ribonuclease III [Thermodesulfobacteriota bacterium]
MELKDLEDEAGYVFNNRAFLKQALTHPTYVNEHPLECSGDNQRLEFLGDTVVNAAITRYLYDAFPLDQEGLLTKKRAELVSEGGLCMIARYIHLGKYLFMGRGEALQGGRDKDSILCDAYEALIGAISVDSDFNTAITKVGAHFHGARGSMKDVLITDYKSILMEYCQSKKACQLQIEVVSETGPEHDKVFVVEAMINQRHAGTGRGANKKAAEQDACREALESSGILP